MNKVKPLSAEVYMEDLETFHNEEQVQKYDRKNPEKYNKLLFKHIKHTLPDRHETMLLRRD